MPRPFVPKAHPAAHSERIAARKTLQAPMLPAALSFAAGIALARIAWRPPALLLLTLLLVALTAWIAAGRTHKAIALAAALLCLALAGATSWELAPRPCTENPATLAQYTHQNRSGQGYSEKNTIEGVITSIRSTRVSIWRQRANWRNHYRPTSTQEHSQHLELKQLQINGIQLPSDFGLQLSLYAPLSTSFPAFHCGEALAWSGRLHMPEVYHDPGVWNSAAYLRSEGIGAEGSITLDQLKQIPARKMSWPQAALCQIRSWQQSASGRILHYAQSPRNLSMPRPLQLSSVDASMLAAMVTGDRTYLTGTTRMAFERTGSFHLLVVSGLHLAIFAGMIFWLARRLRMRRGWATLATIAVSLGYAIFTGWGEPVQRSLWMVTLYLLARLIWREKQRMNAIGLAALGILVMRPEAIAEAGFQMTLLAVLAIGGLAVPLLENTVEPYLSALRGLWTLRLDAALPPVFAQFRVALRILLTEGRWPLQTRMARWFLPWFIAFALRIMELLIVTITIEAAMVLPMAVYFHRITIAGMPVNMFIVPIILFLLPLAILTLLTILLLPALAFIPSAATALTLHLVTGIVTFFSKTHLGNLRVAEPLPLQLAFGLLLLAIAMIALRWHKLHAYPGLALLALSVATVLWPRPIAHNRQACEIIMLDVGQGNSLLVITPEGKTLLIDAGGLENPSKGSRFGMGEDVVSPVLWSLGIRRLDAVAITHGYSEDIGGMEDILTNFHPKRLWLPQGSTGRAINPILTQAQNMHIPILRQVAGDQLWLGKVLFRVLWPSADFQPSWWNRNEQSLVLQVQYGATKALLLSDVESTAERKILKENGLHSALLQVGAHGSKRSTDPEFLASVAPQYAAISVGENNLYDQPNRTVLKELEDAHIRTYRTDLNGLTTFYLNGHQIFIATR